MATSLVSKISSDRTHVAFAKGGPLNFLFYDGEPTNRIRFDYAGLVSALSTLYPEKLGMEFAKTLPDWEEHWQQVQPLQQGFRESFKWRSTDAFTADSLELFNLLDQHHVDRMDLALEVSMTIDHPYNALRLHSHLQPLIMPERDRYWTNWINSSARNEYSQVNRIISWALSSLDGSADNGHLELASVVLAWSFSSSHMELRDRATKALTTIFLTSTTIFDFILEKLYDCDDPYVVERLYAAAFGASCINPTPERLNAYSHSVFHKVFEDGHPPIALLTRDYALGIIELAASKGALNDEVTLERCYHPFNSSIPEFGLTKEKVEQIAVERGGRQIFSSASSEWGDYGKYSIPGRVQSFLKTPLSGPKPLSNQELKKKFLEEIVEPYPERVERLELLENTSEGSRLSLAEMLRVKFNKKNANAIAEEQVKNRSEARKSFEKLLTHDECDRFDREYLREGKGNQSYDSLSVQQCRLWITKRAYELGWTSDLFPNDGHGSGSSRYENVIERIGKKYQRIALDEIQARLADNYWALREYPEEPMIYKYSHQDFRRNIEPTILPNDSSHQIFKNYPKNWMVEPCISLPEVSESDLRQWPFDEDPSDSMTEKLLRVDDNGNRWLVLYEFDCDDRRYQQFDPADHGKRYEEFRFFYCVFTRGKKAKEFTEYLASKESLSGNDFEPEKFVDSPYLLEAFWRDTWQTEKFKNVLWGAPSGTEFAIPIANFQWESHLDKSLPDGVSIYMPQMWFAKELGLSLSAGEAHSWVDDANQVVVQSNGTVKHRTVVVIDENVLRTYVTEFDVEPVWLMIAERGAWPNGNNDNATWRRSEGAVWCEADSWRSVCWSKDGSR